MALPNSVQSLGRTPRILIPPLETGRVAWCSSGPFEINTGFDDLSARVLYV
jgi:hypothetical protein